MRPRGGLMTPDGDPPRAREFRQNDASRGHARLHTALQELKDLLEPRLNCIAEHPLPPGEPHEGSPDWATARFNLGLALAQRADRDRSQNWELAIAAFEDALSVWTREHNPVQWAAARMSLGVAFRERLAGERSDNQERAIAALEESLFWW